MSLRIEPVPGRAGQSNWKVNGRLLHSSFDPVKEAERFLATQNWDGQRPLLVINPGVGHVLDAAHKRNPGARIMVILSDPGFLSLLEARWQPAVLDDSQFQLDTGLMDCHVLVWKPGHDADPEGCGRLLMSLTHRHRESTINEVTGRVFSRQWERNRRHNSQDHAALVLESQGSGLVLIAASGPSLARHQDQLRLYRDRYHLWALPSSMAYLHELGLVPDVVVQSDGGLWALHHHQWDKTATLCLADLRSRLPHNPALRLAPFVSVMDVGSGNQTGIFPPVPDGPSVIVPALALARRFIVGPIIVLGLDMAVNRARAHVAPHTFDGYAAARLYRLSSPWTTESLESAPVSPGSGWYRSTNNNLVARHLRSMAGPEVWQDGPEELLVFPRRRLEDLVAISPRILAPVFRPAREVSHGR